MNNLVIQSAAVATLLAIAMVPAQADTATRGAIIGTLGGEQVRWFVSADRASFWFLGEGEALPNLGGAAYRVPEGVGAISFSVDMSDGREDFLMLEIESADREKVLWRADADSDVTIRASYSQLPEKMASVMGDLRVVLDTVDEAGETAARGAGPELVISFTAQLAQHGH